MPKLLSCKDAPSAC